MYAFVSESRRLSSYEEALATKPFLSDFAVQAGVNQFYGGPVTKSSVLYTGPAPAPKAFSGACGGSIYIPVSNFSIYTDLGADWAGRPQCYRIPSPIPGAVQPQSGAGGVSQSYAGGAGGNLMGGPTAASLQATLEARAVAAVVSC